MVIKFLTPIWRKTPETGSRIRGRVEKVFDWAKVHRFRDGENPARWQGHLEHVFASAKGGNFAAMPFAEVPSFMARLRERDSASAKALQLLILTAARSGEVRLATWDEMIDLDKALWTVPGERMKAGKEHVVPLSDQAVTLLNAPPRIGEYIFPGAVEGKPLSDMALMQLLRGMDANGYKVHGFRSAFRDWAGEETDFDNETIEFALAHGIPDSTKAAYRRYRSLNKRRLLMQSWANYCEGAELADNVILHGRVKEGW
jgi:integrase